MNTPSTLNHTACAYCGADDQPQRPHDVAIRSRGYGWQRVQVCIATLACAKRMRARDAHLDAVAAARKVA